MADKWYYASNGQQRGPVTADELQQLLSSGTVQGSDLVWNEGMPSWVAAESVGQLNPATAVRANLPVLAGAGVGAGADTGEFGGGERVNGHWNRPDQPAPARIGADDFDDIEAAYARQSRKRRGLPVVPIMLGVCALAFVAGCAMFIAPQLFDRSGPRQGSYSWSLGTNQMRVYRVYLEKDKEAIFRVTSDGVSDVDLYIHHGNTLIRQDEAHSKDCFLEFVPSKTGYYKVKVWNRLVIPDPASRNGRNSGTLTYVQAEHARVNLRSHMKEEPVAAEKKKPVEKAVEQVLKANKQQVQKMVDNLKDTKKKIVQAQGQLKNALQQVHPQVVIGPGMEVVDTKIQDVLPNNRNSRKKHTIRMFANYTYTLYLESNAFDPVLELRDGKGKLLARHDDIDFARQNMNSRIVYRARQTGQYQVTVRPFGFRGQGAYRLTIWRKQK